jgi:uncharacterized membrane protein YgcG
MFKKICFILFTIVLICIFTIPTIALTPSECVFDEANILSENDELRLADLSDNYGSMSMVFLTIDNARGYDSKSFAKNFYSTHGFKQDGIIFILDMDNKKVDIVAYGYCEKCLPQNAIDISARSAIDYVNEENYYAAFEVMFYRAESAIANYNPALEDKIDEYRNNNGADTDFIIPTVESIIFSIVVTIIVVIVLLFLHNKNNIKPKASNYYDTKGFVVDSHNTIYLGTREEVSKGYYKDKK